MQQEESTDLAGDDRAPLAAGIRAPGAGERFRMPAEWAPRAATWLGWPAREEDFPGRLEPVRWAFVEILRHLSVSEPVHLLVASEADRDDAADRLERAHADLSAISFHELETDRNWLRDSGAIFARRDSAGPGGADAGELVGLQFRFDAWAKYDNHSLDRSIPPLMARTAGVELLRPTIRSRETGREAWMTLEGGAIDVNGAGLGMATEECLLSDVQERNPGFSREDVEDALRRWLGVERTIWLPGGVDGDDTHGHIDDCARFAGERVVVVAHDPDETTPHHATLRRNLEILREWRDESGGLDVVPLPLPARLEFEDLVLPASPANFYVGASTVLVPTFNDPADRVALGILADLFPDRTVRGIHSVDLIWGLGSIHCMSQQQPAG